MVAGLVLALRPWDASPRRTYELFGRLPRPAFAAASWLFEFAEAVAGAKPAPYRIGEIAQLHVQSQV